MMQKLTRPALTAILLLAMGVGAVVAQEHGSPSAAPSSSASSAEAAQPSEAQAAKPENAGGKTSNEQHGGGANGNVAQILAENTERAAHGASKWGAYFGIGPDATFAISLAVNFAGIVALFYLLFKSKLPQMFRERTAAIQKGIREAEAASSDASRRLSNIEARLDTLDSEVADIRASAEKEASAEEARIRAVSEEDKRKVVEAAETEITAIARNARRELKSYAASLAVELAANHIKVDESTDHALVSEFVEQLGKDGK